MPSTEGEQSKPRQQNPHHRRQKANTKPSSSDKQACASDPAPPNLVATPTKPKSILRRGSQNVAQHIQGVADANSTPATPPRPTSVHDTFRWAQEGEVSATELKGQRRKSDKFQGYKHGGSSSPMPSTATPKSTERPHSMTPRRPNGTPLQAYAGPTFHASPAASTLPLPKFFSKSVPPAEKGTSLSVMMEKEVTETSPEPPSDENEDSPTFGKAQRVGENHVGEESPLDIFFQADRREKARQRSECTTDTLVGAIYNSQPLSGFNPPSGSLQPSNKDVRHHSRHATGSSVGEVFPMEIDDKASNTIPTQKGSKELSGLQTSSIRPNSAPPNAARQAHSEEEQRKAKTLLLKKLLMSPQLQCPADSSSRSNVDLGHIGSSTQEQFPRGQPSPSQNLLGPATTIPGLKSTVPGQGSRHAASLPRLQDLMVRKEQSTGSPRPPSYSSNLRKEVTLPISPARTDLPELPATPTPSRVLNPHSSPKSQVHQNNNTSENASPFVPNFTSNKIFHGMDNAPSHGSTKSMEDDLRRLLNLNVLGGNGTNGVRS